MIWMGLFMAPGLPAINLLKLVIILYTRWEFHMLENLLFRVGILFENWSFETLFIKSWVIYTWIFLQPRLKKNSILVASFCTLLDGFWGEGGVPRCSKGYGGDRMGEILENILTQSKSKTQITSSVHCKFNWITVQYNGTWHGVYIISQVH